MQVSEVSPQMLLAASGAVNVPDRAVNQVS